MKRLTLIRHAKSSWKDPECADFDRPLAKRGKKDAQIMGRVLAARGERPSLIISSPARRAASTMKRIARVMGIPLDTIIWDRRLYHADAAGLLAVICETGISYEHVMVCGHNPGLTDFCRLVADLHIDNLPTCAVVSIESPIDRWQDLRGTPGLLCSYECPKKIVLPERSANLNRNR